MPKKLSVDITKPNLGVYLDRSSTKIPKGGLVDCLNIRIFQGNIIRDNMGWSGFYASDQQLDSAVTLIDNFFLRDGTQFLIFGTVRSLYQHDEASSKALYINPTYTTGSITSSTASDVVTGTGTLWDTVASGRKNVLAGDMIFLGTADEDDPTLTDWGEVLTVDSDTQVTLTANAPVTLTTQPYTVSQRFLSTAKTPWKTEIFNKALVGDEDTWYATNATDDIVRWNGSDLTVTRLGALGFTCETLRVHSNMMIYGNITVKSPTESRPKSIRNSVIGDPEDVSGAGSAENIVDDGSDSILEILSIGDNLSIYSGRTITLAQFIGGTEVWAFRKVIDGIGPLSSRAIVDFGDFHEFIGNDAQYTFDGLKIDEINGHVWRDILRRRSPSRLGFLQAHMNEELGEVIWVVPLATDPGDISTGAPTTAYIEHYLEDVITAPTQRDNPTPFTIRDLPMTASGFFERQDVIRFDDITTAFNENNQRWNDSFFQAAFPFNLFGDENGGIFILGEADSKDGASISSFFRMGRLPSADGRSKTLIERIYPFFEEVSDTITLKVYSSDSFNGSLTEIYNQSFDMSMPEDGYFASVFKTARYHEDEFSTSGIGKPFTFSGMSIDSRVAGKR